MPHSAGGLSEAVGGDAAIPDRRRQGVGALRRRRRSDEKEVRTRHKSGDGGFTDSSTTKDANGVEIIAHEGSSEPEPLADTRDYRLTARGGL